MVNIFNNGLVWCWTCLSEAIDQIKCLIRFTQTRKTNKSNLKYFPKPKNSNNRKNLKISKPEANETQTFRYKRQKVFESWSFCAHAHLQVVRYWCRCRQLRRHSSNEVLNLEWCLPTTIFSFSGKKWGKKKNFLTRYSPSSAEWLLLVLDLCQP